MDENEKRRKEEEWFPLRVPTGKEKYPKHLDGVFVIKIDDKAIILQVHHPGTGERLLRIEGEFTIEEIKE